MFRLDPKRPFVLVPSEAISALYHSVNSTSVLLPGQAQQLAQAVVVGHRLDSRLYGVMIALHFIDSGRHLVYTHDDQGLDPTGAREAAQEAIAFVEAMGFFMESSGWKALDPAARKDCLKNLKVFDPPAVVEETKVVDPRTKLARLLVQF